VSTEKALVLIIRTKNKEKVMTNKLKNILFKFFISPPLKGFNFAGNSC
jgi:hypothetical protein